MPRIKTGATDGIPPTLRKDKTEDALNLAGNRLRRQIRAMPGREEIILRPLTAEPSLDHPTIVKAMSMPFRVIDHFHGHTQGLVRISVDIMVVITTFGAPIHGLVAMFALPATGIGTGIRCTTNGSLSGFRDTVMSTDIALLPDSISGLTSADSH